MVSHFSGWRTGGKGAVRHRHEQGRMNKLEAAYAAEVLEPRRLAGEVAHYDFEVLQVGLADRTWYKIDFLVQLVDGQMEAHEVKGGHWEDDARVKFKVAGVRHAWLKFYEVTQDPRTKAWKVKPLYREDQDQSPAPSAKAKPGRRGAGG